MAAYEVLLLNTAIPQIQAAQSGDTYVVPRDIAFSAALTLSAGTANGVPYLNASKVLTSGSALTFDGDTLTARSVLLIANSQSYFGDNGVIGGGAADGNTTIRYFGGKYLAFKEGPADRMLLNTTGLGIGTSSPATRLHAVGDNVPGRGQVSMQTSTAANFAQITFYDRTTLGAQIYQGYQATAGVGDLTIQTAGASSALVFGTNATERARITSDGDFLVGKNALSQTTVGFQVEPTGVVSDALAASANTTTTLNIYSTGASAYRFYVGLGGTVYATNTTISAISDQRLKENIRDLDVGLNAVLALKPRKFDWKAGKGKDKKDDRGFIAQEFEQVFPDLIDTWKDPAPEGEEPYKSVRADLIPVLVKAIQEQQAMINELKAEVAALKGA